MKFSDYECPQCGCGSKDLKPEAQAEIIRHMGNSAVVKCAVCNRVFMLTVDREAVS